MNDRSRATRADSQVTVSSNTLFHFTNTYRRLKGILEREFEPRFCLEQTAAPEDGRDPAEFAFPMVCFCDLPLSQTATHLAFYGNYGLGLTKEWGQKHGVTPILYAYTGSAVASSMQKLWAAFDEKTSPPEMYRALAQIVCYIKPYSGRFWRAGAYLENVRFYNEREWRFVPPDIYDNTWILPKEQYLDTALLKRKNREACERSRLSFEPRDIRYIVVANEEEVLKMIDDILRIKGNKYTYDDLRLLTTRIISARQIREDF